MPLPAIPGEATEFRGFARATWAWLVQNGFPFSFCFTHRNESQSKLFQKMLLQNIAEHNQKSLPAVRNELKTTGSYADNSHTRRLS